MWLEAAAVELEPKALSHNPDALGLKVGSPSEAEREAKTPWQTELARLSGESLTPQEQGQQEGTQVAAIACWAADRPWEAKGPKAET